MHNCFSLLFLPLLERAVEAEKVGAGLLCTVIILSCGFSSSASDKNNPQFTIVHITDTHHTSTPPKTTSLSRKHYIRIFGYKLHKPDFANSTRILQNTLEHINKEIKPDMVVITGDIVDRGDDREGMKQVKNMLNKLNCPWYTVIGDHDLNSGQDEKENYKEVFGKINYSLDYKGWNVIMLGIHPGDNDLEWLKNELDAKADKPAILCMHKMLIASWLMKKLSKRHYCPELTSPKAGQILNILSNHGRTVVVLSGHSHTNYRTSRNSISYISTASLVEPPYQFRIIKVYKDRISTSVRTAHPLKGK